MKRDGAQTTREIRALELRLAGASYRQIGLQTGVSHAQAFRDVQTILKEYLTEPTEEVRKVELGRLDSLLVAHWIKATAGDYKATTMVLAIMDRRARLLGLDAPVRIDITAWIREMAEREGLDPVQAQQDAEAILRLAQA